MDKPGQTAKVSPRFMKRDFTTTILQLALAVSLIASVIFCIQYINRSRTARSLNGQVMAINQYRTTVQAFVNECVAYSEKNPAILPILESVGIRKNPAANRTTR